MVIVLKIWYWSSLLPPSLTPSFLVIIFTNIMMIRMIMTMIIMMIRSNSLPRTFNREALLRHPELSMELDRWSWSSWWCRWWCYWLWRWWWLQWWQWLWWWWQQFSGCPTLFPRRATVSLVGIHTEVIIIKFHKSSWSRFWSSIMMIMIKIIITLIVLYTPRSHRGESHQW